MSRPALPLSSRAMTIYAAVAAVSFSAASSAPTPLYHFYQQTMGLSPALVTVIFGAYALALLAALLTVARLSDHIGRKPMILVALGLDAVALVLFSLATSATLLIVARLVQGFATGIALTTLGAAILDTDRRNGPLLNSVTAFVGLTSGSLLAGVLLAAAPLPGQLVYLVLLAVMAVEAALLALLPETTERRPGALAVLRPHVHVPAVARAPMLRLLPLNVAGWALGGLYLSLMPTLVVVATGMTSPIVGASVVALLMLVAAIVVVALRRLAPERLLAIGMAGLGLGIAVTLFGIHAHLVTLMLVGTAIAGVGFGTAFAGNLGTLLPLAGAGDRAALLAAYLVESYLAFSLPAIAAGLLVPVLGLVATVYLYGGVLLAFILLSGVLAARPPRRVPALG